MKKLGSEPALARPIGHGAHEANHEQDGISYRRYLAAFALEGLLTNPQNIGISVEGIGKLVWRVVDAVLAQEEK